jgi:hypothetical protein
MKHSEFLAIKTKPIDEWIDILNETEHTSQFLDSKESHVILVETIRKFRIRCKEYDDYLKG